MRTRWRLETIASSRCFGLTVCLGDFAQRDDRILVAVAIDGEVGTARNLASALRRHQYQVEPVGNLVDTIFDRHARHCRFRLLIRQADGKAAR